MTGVSGISTATNGYGYDALQRLRVVTNGAGSALESYTYNPTGDRLSKTTSFQDGGTYNYASGTHHLASIGAYARTYDAAGDAAGDTLTATMAGEPFVFRFNARDRLDQVTRSGAVVGTYTFDALGERVKKVATAPDAATTRYGYDEQQQLIAEQTNGASREYVYLANLPVAVVDTGAGAAPTTTISYLQDDALGTPRVATNVAGTVVWQWPLSNNAFGEQPPVDTGGLGLNLRFPGQYYDAESGLLYNINRNYDPPSGRYLRPDQIGQAAGPSLYGYVGGNPQTVSDPSGRCPWCAGAIIGAVAGGIAGYEAGGWKGAVLGGLVGGAAGAIAPTFALSVGNLASQVTESLLIRQAATAVTFVATNSAGGAGATVATNYWEGEPLTKDLLIGATIGAVSPLVEAGTVAVWAGEVGGSAGANLMSVFSGINGIFLTASTLPTDTTAGCK
ncbi:MAG: hypothetical protein ABS98_05020 [Lysobacteraceae bacterium SCN 69-48]|nr:MAG: hypothetical protein ABS98_05020 [Xanthomonadaceae bacterium SCN 69-48]